METPALKYYFPTPFSLKLRIYITKTHILKIALERTSYMGIECLFYCKADPCQKAIVKFTGEILSWLLSYAKKQPTAPGSWIKPPTGVEDQAIASALLSLKFGSWIPESVFLAQLGLEKINFSSWLQSHPFIPLLPAHRVICSKAPSAHAQLLSALRAFEETSL